MLPKGSVPSDQPVWGESIIIEEIQVEPPSSPQVPEKVAPVAEEIPAEPVTVTPDTPDKAVQVTEKTSAKTVEDVDEDVITTPPAPAEPAFDLEAVRNKAFASGVKKGRKEADEDFENGINTLLSICNELDKLRENILKNSIPEMKELVMQISEKVIRHSITDQEETITATVIEAIRLAVKSDEIHIQINPDDLKFIELKKQEIIDSIGGLENITLQSDLSIERGGCKLDSSCCTVDATLSNQIKVIKDTVMADDASTTK